MNLKALTAEIDKIPAIDMHSHMNHEEMNPSHPEQLLFYHMLTYPMASSGAEGSRLWPWEAPQDAQPSWESRLAEWFRYLPQAENTSFFGLLREIFSGLYRFDGALSSETYPDFLSAFERTNADPARAAKVCDSAGIVKILTSRWHPAPPKSLPEGDRFGFTFERFPISGPAEYNPWSTRLRLVFEKTGTRIRSTEDLDGFLAGFFGGFDWSDLRAFVCWVSAMADFTPVGRKTADRLLKLSAAGRVISPTENRLLDAGLIRAICRALQGRARIFQLVYGVQYLHKGKQHGIQRADAEYATGLGYLAAEFPGIHFNILNGYEPHEPELCSLALAYPNVSLGGFWWQTFYPSVMRASLGRRLDMVPVSRLMGFFSDGYCLDWVWARLRQSRRIIAEVLSDKMEREGWNADLCLRTARALLHDTPKKIFLG
jgi:glucuronate isomerase